MGLFCRVIEHELHSTPVIMGLPTDDDDDNDNNDYLFESHLIFMTPSFDITQMVIDQLNKEWLMTYQQS